VTTGVLRVAAAQATSIAGDVPANVATALSLVASAADRGARVVVLPELFLTGYDPSVWRHDSSLALDDPVLDSLVDQARARSVVVVVGAAVRRALDSSTLSVLVVDADGVDAPYDKQHVDRDEAWFFTPGSRGSSIVVDGWELGLGICYDASFPEHARAAAVAGATAYLCSAAYFTGSESRRDLYGAARALDNGMYVVVSGLTGRCGAGQFSGGSAVYDPQGRAVDRVGDASPAVVVADLDPAEVSRVRARHPMLDDRVADLGTRARVPVR
jgi:predicted amidohydrolase